ncbi:TonB-dependent receptor [Segetibacter koreensis]|uniref:TonB-dependent receptor n=1 Tax=Segetibacter koreensis TaxID=398037 RepID=UPI00036506BF|nr:Plug domain-containing protein [Segetibacter koreensis]
MPIKFGSSLLFYLLLTSAVTFAQTPATNSVSELFTKFRQISNDKNIVLLNTRNIYIAGEKIWFTTYIVDANSGKLDLTTKNLFADLVNERDSTIEQVVLDNKSLHTKGAFKLPASIPTGFYWIRCYTARNLERNGDGILLHPVFILNKQLHDESSYEKQFKKRLEKNTTSGPNIHFFAERLTALQGIISTGVIEIKDSYQNPLSVKGELVNSKDSIITTFNTNSLGLARLTFVNAPGEPYTAVFHLNGQNIKYQLLDVDKKAIQLSVVNQTEKTVKAIVTLEDSVPPNTQTTLLAVQRDSLYYAAVGTGNFGLTIPIDRLPGGIARLLLFDENKNLVSERKIYIPKENVSVEIKPDKEQYSKRAPVNLHIKVSGPNGKPVASVINVAVEDAGIAQISDSIDANTPPPFDTFLLNNWLHRYHTKYSADDIDLLLATRKASFQQPSGKSINRESQDYDDNKKLKNLIGKIANRNNNGISDRIVTAIARNSRDFFIDVDTTKKDGLFNLSMPQGFDSLQLSLQVADKHQVPTGDSIKIETFQYPNFSTPSSLKQQFIGYSRNALALLQKYRVDTAMTFQCKGWLAPVTVKTIKKEELNYDASKRINPVSQILTSDKFRYGGYNALGNAILLVPGVSLSFGDISIFGPSNDLRGNIGRPLIIVDGSEVSLTHSDNRSVLDYLNALNPADIDFIEVLRGAEASIYGMRGGSGVISINTRHGGKTDFSRSKLRLFNPVTYHVSPDFEMPDYSNKEVKNTLIADPRTTLYWKGNVPTDANGAADVNFYTGDNVTNYTITITGLTTKGDLIYKRVIISNTGKN